MCKNNNIESGMSSKHLHKFRDRLTPYMRMALPLHYLPIRHDRSLQFRESITVRCRMCLEGV